MNVWFLTHPMRKNYCDPWVRATATIITMSIFILARQSSRCHGFRIGSIVSREGVCLSSSRLSVSQLSLPVVSRRMSSTRLHHDTHLERSWRQHNRYPTAASRALFSTTGKEIKESQSSIDESDISQSLLYREFRDLALEIKRHDELYYGGENITGTESISDNEFDALVRREEEIESKHPELLKAWQLESGLGKAATRSGRVGAGKTDISTNTGRAKRRHLSPMLSLDNVHNEDQLQTWLKRIVKAAPVQNEGDSSSSMVTILTEPKLDGVSLSLRYESSSPTTKSGDIPLELKWASTRGDGTIGQDVTAAAKQMSGIPDTIYVSPQNLTENEAIALEVRGEVVLPRSEFLKLQQQAEIASTTKEKTIKEESFDTNKSSVASFSNPRNAASGILLRKESEDVNEQAASKKLRSLLRFYAYDLSGFDGESEMDGIKLREQLSEWKFSLAMPIATTNLEWTNNDDLGNAMIEIESAAESKALWDDWFEETIVNEQIQPILEYFSALEEHRELLQEEDSTNSTLPTNTSKKSPSSNYEWGDFDMDGCVHKVTQASIRSTMGYTTKSPKWATAHKFPAQASVARLLDIVVQVGRTGAITPVAVLEPTEVGGVIVQRATLHNFGHLQEIMGFESSEKLETGVAKIPKYEPLLVQRAGDVIPQVVRRIKSQSIEDSSATEWVSLDPPDKCPFCSSAVTYDAVSQSSSGVGQVVRCSGPPLLCPPRAVTSLKHAFSRDAMDLTGLSEARIQQLMDADLMKFPADIFTMEDEQWESLENLPGWGKRSSQNLRESSKQVASRGMSLGRFIYSLGIRHLGKHTSELVASCFGSTSAFFEAVDSASRLEIDQPDDEKSNDNRPFPELENKLGVGPVAIDSLFAFSKSRELVDAAKTLADSLNISEQNIVLNEDEEDSSPGDDDQPWKGFRVVFTGSLGIVDGLTRSKAQEIAKQLGAIATPGSVSKSTDLVVFGEKGGKKLTQARDLGIATMEAEEFVKIAKENRLLDDR